MRLDAIGRSQASQAWRKWYDTAEWQRLRLDLLQREPLCTFCWAKGRTTPATVADHIKDHKGNRTLFFDPKNLQSLCKPCHDKTKSRMATGRNLGRTDADGWQLPNDQGGGGG